MKKIALGKAAGGPGTDTCGRSEQVTRRQIAAEMLRLSATAATSGEESLHVILDRLLAALRGLGETQLAAQVEMECTPHRTRLRVRAALLRAARELA